ncbi:MAG: hypothetical protein HQ568_06770, partial [Calditrichaeota bacterium]|nr:hypothetical protein [Calditrichota bacterium]
MGAIFVTIAVLILLSALLNTGMTAISGASQGELRLSHPRTASYISPQSAITSRNGTFNILALRVEFKRDTLSTTTGDGSFDYDAKDSVYYDPPPHDSQYFSDMLEFNRFYWQEMSNGAIDFTWDIYPLDSQAAYQLPKKMWQYNYNYPTDRNSSHLDSTLSLLFRDAVAVADSDTAIVWADYDLVVIFHAGSGAEFDLGFTVTPHDIPSAWMVKKDFELIEMDEGIPVSDNGVTGFVTEGLILPETESHDDVQISMAGVVVFLFGHWLGLPALYDRDNGDAVVGKWSLLDRGFGNFYGVLPGPVDAWSKTYMGWLNPVELTPGNWSISARGFELPGLSDTIQAAKVYITQDEYFLLECRYRSTVGEFKDDSVAVLYDSNDSMMFLKEDYSVDTERTADNFRVPVRADNLDFDTPGSGILIWHVDESLLPLVQDGRFNSVDAHRGLDLEEADGAQDIGRDYPFLTAGYGTDYGIFEDAWFRNNEAHRNANKRDAITFGEGTFPNSRANSGAFSGIAIGNFSFTDIVMSFTFTNSGWLYDLPIQHDLDAKLVAVGNFDNTPDDQEFVIFGSDSLNIFDGDGDILARVPYGKEYYIYQHNDPIVRNLDNDDYSEVVWTVLDEAASNSNAVILCLDPDPVNGFQIEIIDTFVPSHSSMRSDTKIAFGGAEDQTVIQVLQPIRQANEIISLLRSYDSDFAPLAETELSG